MDTHVKVLGVLYIALSALGVLFALLLLVGFGSVVGLVGSTADPDEAAIALPIIGLVGTGVVALGLLFFLPGLITGVGLLYLRPWARILGIVLSAISLVGFPIWTALGIYGLWVLFSRDTERLFSTVPVSP